MQAMRIARVASHLLLVDSLKLKSPHRLQISFEKEKLSSRVIKLYPNFKLYQFSKIEINLCCFGGYRVTRDARQREMNIVVLDRSVLIVLFLNGNRINFV